MCPQQIDNQNPILLGLLSWLVKWGCNYLKRLTLTLPGNTGHCSSPPPPNPYHARPDLARVTWSGYPLPLTRPDLAGEGEGDTLTRWPYPRHVISTGPLAYGHLIWPPIFGFYWPRLASLVQKPNLLKIIANKFIGKMLIKQIIYSNEKLSISFAK